MSAFFCGGFTEDAQQRNFLSCHSHAKAVDNSKLEFKVILISRTSDVVAVVYTLIETYLKKRVYQTNTVEYKKLYHSLN